MIEAKIEDHVERQAEVAAGRPCAPAEASGPTLIAAEALVRGRAA